MDYKNDFEQWKPTFEAVKEEEVKLPNIPIDVLCAESDHLVIEATKDKDALIAKGLDWNLVDELTTLTGALRYCQAQWMSEYQARQEAPKQWSELSPEAYDLRNELLHHFTYGYRDDKNILKKVSRIRQGSGHADMIQDLLELSVLAQNNPEPLVMINYDVRLNDKAISTSAQMANLLALVNGSKDESSQTKLLRDQAFTLLSEKMNTIRECGRYVFWRNEERREKYASDYHRD
ncbi:hypothetical protein E9993_07015 [Labilibacter sediminis]|nr:hypothetical protein E9993_07015 [Labilibacter sediminis]